MNMRNIVAFVVGFVVLGVYGFVVHGNLLADMYAAQPEGVWRSEEAMMSLMWSIYLGYAIMAAVLACFFATNIAGADMNGNIKFGLRLGVFLGAVQMINYAVMPIALNLALVMFGVDIIMVVLTVVLMGIAARAIKSA